MEHETIDYGFVWNERPMTGDFAKYTVAELAFGTNRYSITDYSHALYDARHRTDFPDIPTAEGLLHLIRITSHLQEAEPELNLLKNRYPEKLSWGLEALVQLADVRTTADVLVSTTCKSADDDVSTYPSILRRREILEESRYAPDSEPCAKTYLAKDVSQEITDAIMSVILHHSPPVGTSRNPHSYEASRGRTHIEVADYLPTEKIRARYGTLIPRIGVQRIRIRQEIADNPAAAVEKVLANLPAYNAGKLAYAMEGVFKEHKDCLDPNHLIGLVQGQEHIGTFDKAPYLNIIADVWR